MTPYQQRTIARAQARIRADIEAGIVPPNVRDFSQLHDFVDANVYMLDDAGDFDAELEGLTVDEITREVMGPVVDALDVWLQSGRHDRSAAHRTNIRQVVIDLDRADRSAPEGIAAEVAAALPDALVRVNVRHGCGDERSAEVRGAHYVGGGSLSRLVQSNWWDATIWSAGPLGIDERHLRSIVDAAVRNGVPAETAAACRKHNGRGLAAATEKREPNTVFMDVRARDGWRIAVLTAPHDGTRAGIVAAADRLQQRALARFSDHTHAGSRLFATDATGALGWVISPNLAHVSRYDSPEARETLGLPKRNGAEGVVFARDAVEELNRVRPMRRGSALQSLYLTLAQNPGARVPRDVVVRALKNIEAHSSPNAARAASMVRRTLGTEAAVALPPQGAASAAVKLMHFSSGHPAIGAVIAAWRANAPVPLETAQQALAELDATPPSAWLAEDHWLARTALGGSIRAAHAPGGRKPNRRRRAAKALYLTVSGRGATRTLTSQLWADPGGIISEDIGRLEALWPGYDLGSSHHAAAAQAAVHDHHLKAGDTITLYAEAIDGSLRVVNSWVVNAERKPHSMRG